MAGKHLKKLTKERIFSALLFLLFGIECYWKVVNEFETTFFSEISDSRQDHTISGSYLYRPAYGAVYPA